MKKTIFFAILSLLLICLPACSDDTGHTDTEKNSASSSIETTTVTTNPDTSLETTAETDAATVIQTEAESLPIPNDGTEFTFRFSSASGKTTLSLNKDGSFTGCYIDSYWGLTEPDYPNGTTHICNFTGKFVDFVKVNDYTYKMSLADLQTKEQQDAEWIEDGTLYIGSIPFGIDGDKEFFLYLPDAPVDTIPSDSLLYWPYNGENPQRSTLSCYTVFNSDTNSAFFGME